MPATLKHVFVALTLLSATMSANALTTASTTLTDQDVQTMLAQSQPAQPRQAPAPTSQPTLRIGLSDPNTQLVLPWFLADLVDAVNQRTSPHDLAKKLRDGI
ncbi:hypothetical protein [Ralstonia sp. UBA689]|uniref:hypothetical protein n=1 Tax=Ralstonia sp. UBA689 TaxID=1947373 RepID=UPI0025F15A85|nr:hypothetical protein [Ralstonia sp. UBA689]